MPGDLPRFRNQIQRCSRQRRHVQRLANVAGSVRPAGVLVNKNAATGEIQQGHAAQEGQRALSSSLPKNSALRAHKLIAISYHP